MQLMQYTDGEFHLNGIVWMTENPDMVTESLAPKKYILSLNVIRNFRGLKFSAKSGQLDKVFRSNRDGLV